MRKYSKFIIVFAVTILLLIIVELNRPKEIDWSYSFSRADKIPYGNFILFKILPDLFLYEDIESTELPIYNTLVEYDTTSGYCYIFINDIFSPDELDTKNLLEFVKRGNNVFIAANSFNGDFCDSIKIITGVKFHSDKTTEINFVNNKLTINGYYQLKNSPADYYFTKFDTSQSIVLGVNKDYAPNFIKVNYGEGNFYLNTVPLAFTNYNILDSINSGYIYKSLSYLPSESYVYWDEYYKTNKSMIRTPLRFILTQESLAWAYYILILSIIAYLVFFGKRKQRIIPVIKPLANTTLEFVKLIGRLYFQQKNHKNIADKKVSYFLDQLRIRYFIKTDEINEETLQRISGKSGIALSVIKETFNYIKFLSNKPKITENELSQINNLIESFYKRAGIHGGTT